MVEPAFRPVDRGAVKPFCEIEDRGDCIFGDRQRIRRASRKSEFEHTQSIWNVAGSRAMTWMIGFKRKENSNLRRGPRMLANIS